jgi:hypothetical protein
VPVAGLVSETTVVCSVIESASEFPTKGDPGHGREKRAL